MTLDLPRNILLWDKDEPPPSTNDIIIFWNAFKTSDFTSSSISIPDYVDENSTHLRTRFLGFVHEIGNSQIGTKTVIEHLQIRPTFSYWWLTLFASKRWHPNSHVNEAVKIIALEEILADLKWSQILVQSENEYLHSLIKQLTQSSSKAPNRITKKLIRACGTLVRQILTLRSVIPMSTSKDKSDIILFDHLTRFDQVAASDGEFHSLYWGSLEPILKEQNRQVSWIHQFVETELQKSPKDSQKILSTINSRSQQKHFLLESRLSKRVVKRCLRDFCKLLRAGFKTRHIAECFSLSGSKLNLWPLFQDEWYESLLGSTAMRHLLILATTEESLSQVPHCETGIYLMENQPWEIALLHSWSAAGHGRIIGLVNAPIRFWDVRYFSDQRSLSPFGNDHIHFQPQPPEIFVNGPLSRKLLEDSGIKPHQIGDVEPLMYQYLQNDTSSKVDQGNDILVLGDFFTNLTKRIISLVVESQQLSGDRRNVLFKPHPLNRDPLSHLLGANFTPTNAPLSELFEMCSIVIAPSASTGALEAYCANKSVVSILEPSTLNYTPLKGVEGAMFVKNSHDLANILIITPEVHSSNRRSLFFLDSQLSRWKDMLSRSGLQN
jgi:surface carbohydrate biosynthesis protein (TIGR04326 family)